MEDPQMLETLENTYIKMAELKPHKDEKNLREDEERFPVCDYVMTEKTILKGFEEVFGVKCDIFAKIFYIHASKMQDYAKLDFMDFIGTVMPLHEGNIVKRNRHVFDMLDTDKDG